MRDRSSGGIKLADVLLVVFITLKLVGVIDWSWIWVFSPLWISIIATVVFLVLG